MPTLITEERKQQIAKRHKELVDELNAFIANKKDKLVDQKLLNGYLDTNSIVKSFTIANEMEEMKVRQNQILDELSSKNPLHIIDDRKWLVCAIKSENTPYAKAYNEKLYSDYQENPDKVKALLFRKVMTFDPHKFNGRKDNDLNLLEFYKENHEVVDLADVLANSNGATFYEGQNRDFVEAIDQMSETLNVIAYPKHLADKALTDDFYAMPYVSAQQAQEIVINADKAGKDIKGYTRDHLEALAGNDLTVTPKAYFNAISNTYLENDVDEKFLSTYIPLQLDNNIEPTFADYSDAIKDPSGYQVFKRQEKKSFNIRAINDEFSKVYQKNWLKSFNGKNREAVTTSIKDTLTKNKGGFFEKLFNTTSKEYKEYEKALEDYNNPGSDHYLDDKHLRTKSVAYLDHKGVNANSDLSRLDETAKNRVKLVLNTVQNLDDSDRIEKNAEKELEQGYPAKTMAFLSEKDVSEDSIEKENDDFISNEIKKGNVIDINDVDMKI